MRIDSELTEKSAKNTQRWWKLTATIVISFYSIYNMLAVYFLSNKFSLFAFTFYPFIDFISMITSNKS